MRNLNSKEYQMTIQHAERMANGAAIHKNEDKFPATIDENDLRNKCATLEAARNDYEQKQRDADKAYDAYTSLFKELSEQLSKNDDAVRGYYGKDKAVIADFGTNVMPKIRSTHKAKDPAKDPAGAKS